MERAPAMINKASTNEAPLDIECYSPYMIMTNGVWLGDDPLKYALPLFLIQLLIITLTTRALRVVLKPLCQPTVMAEIIAGMLLGPSVAGRFFPAFSRTIFPPRSIATLSSVGNLGLLYFVFMVGVEMDVSILKRAQKKLVAIGTISIAAPFAISLAAAYVFRHYLIEDSKNDAFYIYLAAALSVTSFPLLARILSELKLLGTEIGRVSLVSSVINDLLSWVFLAVMVAFTGNGMQTHYILLSSLCFVLACVYLVQPVLKWMVSRTPDGEPMSDMDLGVVIMGVMVSGFITESIGIHCTFGAFVYGLVFPHGAHGTALVERLEHIVHGFMLPIYFGRSGSKADISTIKHSDVIAVLTFISILASVAKVITTTVVSLHLGIPIADCLSIGFLMNSQGLADVILLNMARDKDLIEPETYAIMAVISILVTAMMTPLVKVASKPMRSFAKYKRRTIMHGKPDAELRMLACVHSSSNASSVINLLDLSSPATQSPLFVSALHLVELTGRESAMLIVHETSSRSRPSISGDIGCSFHRNQAQTEHIISTFESYQRRAAGVSVQSVTAIAPYSSMHADICRVAAENRSAVIVLPFDAAGNGIAEANNLSIRSVNRNVLNRAPCSVAILVDRGLEAVKPARNAGTYSAHRVIVLFFGGPDDREALAIASRMAEHPSVALTLVRFVFSALQSETNEFSQRSSVVTNMRNLDADRFSQRSSVVTNMRNLDADRDQVLDEECVGALLLRNMGDKSFGYVEKAASSSEEIVAAIKSMNWTHGLYVVGRSQRKTWLMDGMLEWAEYPELGAIGDLLASTDVDEMLSVLVVQQYTRGGSGRRRGVGGGCDEAEAMVQPNAPEKTWQKCVSSANVVEGDAGRAC